MHIGTIFFLTFFSSRNSNRILAQVTFARNCSSISAQLVLDTPEKVDLCVIMFVKSAKIWCVCYFHHFLANLEESIEKAASQLILKAFF